MKIDELELKERTVIYKIIISSNADIKYSINKRTGIFKRKFGMINEMESRETGSSDESENISLRRRKRDNPGSEKFGDEFIPSVILKENEFLIDHLKEINLHNWEIVIKKFINKRDIVRSRREYENLFSHNSILIRMRDRINDGFIEVGEGNTDNLRFNQIGLKNRLDEILLSNRKSSVLNFPDEVPVVLSPGDGGIIFHEILGHSLEADHIFDSVSPFKVEDRGRKVASDNLTLTTRESNDPFFKKIRCDDEGETPASKYLMKNGIIKSFISDTYYGNMLGIRSRGFSRQESFSAVPIPRMFSLYISPGKSEPDDLISSVGLGVYAKEFGEGKVLFNQNIFYFDINSAYVIRNGKISEPLGKIVVKGNIDKTLNSIDMVASDFQYDRGISYCLKKGQFLNVRIGQPTVKIAALTITRGRNGR